MTQFDPPPPRPLPPPGTHARREWLLREFGAGPSRSPSPRRRWLVVLPVAALVMTGGAWAAGLFGGDEITQPDRVECYASASLAAAHTPAVPGLSGDAPGAKSPRALCTPFYARGYLTPAGGQVPQLVSCVGGGLVRVFPGHGASTCRRLGLEPLPDAQYRRTVRRIQLVFRTAQRALVEAQGGEISFSADGTGQSVSIPGSPCLRKADALGAVRAALSRARLTGFDVVVDPRTRASDCVTDATTGRRFDGHTVVLQPVRLLGLHHQTPGELRRAERLHAAACKRSIARSAGEVLDQLQCSEERLSRRHPHRGFACFTPREIVQRARRVLAASSLRGWKIRVRPAARSDRPAFLTSAAADPRIRELTIIFGRACR